MKERIKSCINNLKHLPGVYLMHDKDDKIIYIGKAKDLYKRVSQYFLLVRTRFRVLAQALSRIL